ncbi:uncharacterized protein LOC115879266 [Sitophilus oryzae]|uniref:Uncharacterized protein LOC115879266 n=1 Tax=Sitophilus oryzae TaxID=7048 RepID=A0A6J2XK09_SITOR|nr:uncharacterized protein LOC115879266 [Sitophilus oryzae]
MDKDLLIATVFEKTPVWDKKHKLHSNRTVVDKCWKEISVEMNEDEVKLRKQWKYLRDQYSVELGKHPLPRSGDAAEDTFTSKWRYFPQLHFLKDVVKPRVSSGNLSSTQSSQVTFKEESQSSVEFDENGGDEEDFDSSEQVVAKKRRGKDTYQESILDIERRNVEYYLESEAKQNSIDQEDEHLSFFKSLLPHVRKIPENRLLSFRCRIQEIVDQFAYQLNIHSTPSSAVLLHSDVPSPGYHIVDSIHQSVPSRQQSSQQ